MAAWLVGGSSCNMMRNRLFDICFKSSDKINDPPRLIWLIMINDKNKYDC